MVGSSAIRTLGLQASAIAIIAHGACHPRAARVFACFARRLRNPDPAEHLHALAATADFRQVLMQPDRLADLLADGQHRLSEVIGSWRSSRAVAAHIAHSGLVELQQVAAIEPHTAANDPSRRIEHHRMMEARYACRSRIHRPAPAFRRA